LAGPSRRRSLADGGDDIYKIARAIRQESLANAKVSARQHCVYEDPRKEMYGKSMQGTTMLKSTFMIQWVSTL